MEQHGYADIQRFKFHHVIIYFKERMADQKQNKLDLNNLDAGQKALMFAEFFMSLGETCLEFYHKYNLEKQKKTKMIKKNLKQKNKVIRRWEGEGEQLNEDMKKKLPKKPLTAYIIYFQQKKPNFVEKYPGLNLSDLTKLIAKQWKQIDDNRRKPYLAQAQEDRKRYDKQMREFRIKYGAVATNNQQNEEENMLINEEIPEGEQIINGQQQLIGRLKGYEGAEQIENIQEQKPEESGENENANDNDNDNDNDNEGEDNGEEGEGEGSQNQYNEQSGEKEEDD